MLKHTKLTTTRIEQFIQFDLAERQILSRAPLQVAHCPEPHATEREARLKGPWHEVQPGFRYGPAYRMVWFHVTGRVPSNWAGGEVALIAEVGGERTVWKRNQPIRGIDEPHSLFRLTDSSKGGERIDFLIQAYTGNPQCRVHRRELPRQDLVEEFKCAELVLVDTPLVSLTYDSEFAFDLMQSLGDEDPAHGALLRALNDVCNMFGDGSPERIARCRKRLKDAMGSLTGEAKHTVTPVGHAHLDTAWLWPLAITRLKMAHTTANQLYLMERYPEHVFVHSQASQYEWLEHEYPRLLERVKKAIATGQWEVLGSMWVEADCNLSGGEALVRQFFYGKRYFQQKFGVETEDMWLPDVFGYSAALPQILKKFGIQYFLTQKISWNQFNKFPHHTFWWQGIDGTKVWTHFPPADTYIGSCMPSQILYSVKNYKDHGRCDHSLYVFGWGDGGGGPTEKHVEMLRRGSAAGSLPAIEQGRKATDFFKDARARSVDLATWVGELYFELHRGTYTSQAANKRGNRECEFLLRDAEALCCLTDSFTKRYPAQELESAWKLLLLNQFHDILPGSSVREVYEDSDRDYASIRSTAHRLIDQSLQTVGKRIDTKSMGMPIALFHHSVVGSQVTVPWDESEAPTAVECGEESLPVQVVEAFGERNLIFKTPECALGAVCTADMSFRAPSTRNRLKASGRRLENDELSVRFDSHGNITSITTLDDRPIEFIQPGKLGNLFQVLEDKPTFWSAWDVDAYAFETDKDLIKSDSFEIVERGPVRVAVEVTKRFGSSGIRQRISLGPTPGIRFDTEIDWHEEDKMLKVAFPINVNATRATFEIQYGHVERPTHMNTSWDMARFEVCAQKWVDVSEGGHGAALINCGKYGYDVQGGVIRLSLLRSPKAPDPMCDMGLHRFSYVLLPHYESFIHAGVVHAAYAVNAEPRWSWLKPSAGEPAQLPPLVSVEDRNLVVEAVKKAADSNHMVVRLYECHNTRGSAEMSCVRGVKRAWLADLREHPIRELDVVDGMVMLDYKPFEIITVLLQA